MVFWTIKAVFLFFFSVFLLFCSKWGNSIIVCVRQGVDGFYFLLRLTRKNVIQLRNENERFIYDQKQRQHAG